MSRVVAALALMVTATAVDAKVFLSQDEALRLAFPGATVARKTAFLTLEQQREAQRLSGDETLPSALAVYYVATKDGREVGTAYFDQHVVRTMSETIMVVVDPSGNALRVEVLSFQEPEDYLPRPHWYEQFQGKPLDGELSMKRGIRPIAGATLTARATVDATRRVLALHRVVQRAAAGKIVSP